MHLGILDSMVLQPWLYDLSLPMQEVNCRKHLLDRLSYSKAQPERNMQLTLIQSGIQRYAWITSYLHYHDDASPFQYPFQLGFIRIAEHIIHHRNWTQTLYEGDSALSAACITIESLSNAVLVYAYWSIFCHCWSWECYLETSYKMQKSQMIWVQVELRALST